MIASLVFDARRPRPQLVGIFLGIDIGTAADDATLLEVADGAGVHRRCASLLLAVGGPVSANARAAVVGTAPTCPCRRSSKGQGCRYQKSFVHFRHSPNPQVAPELHRTKGTVNGSTTFGRLADYQVAKGFKSRHQRSRRRCTLGARSGSRTFHSICLDECPRNSEIGSQKSVLTRSQIES